MSTVPVLSIADELVAELESIYMAGWDASGEGWNAEYPGDAHDKPEFQLAMRDACAPVLSVILSERAEMQQQLRAAMISVDNCELFRRDAERYQFWRYMVTHEPAKMARILASCVTPDEIDAAIDAAMQEPKQ